MSIHGLSYSYTIAMSDLVATTRDTRGGHLNHEMKLSSLNVYCYFVYMH